MLYLTNKKENTYKSLKKMKKLQSKYDEVYVRSQPSLRVPLQPLGVESEPDAQRRGTLQANRANLNPAAP